MLPILQENNTEFSFFISHIDDIKNLLENFTKLTGITEVKFSFSKFDVGSDWVSIVINNTNIVVNSLISNIVLKIILYIWSEIKSICKNKKEKEENTKELEIPNVNEYIKVYVDKRN